MIQEEKDKIEEWKGRVKNQDEKLEEIMRALRQIKGKQKKLGTLIKILGKELKKQMII